MAIDTQTAIRQMKKYARQLEQSKSTKDKKSEERSGGKNKGNAKVSVTLPPSLLKRLDTEVSKRKKTKITDATRSAIIRSAIDKFLSDDR